MSGNDSTIKYEFLDSSKNFIYDARETGKTHTSFLYELQLFNAIKNGDIHGVKLPLKPTLTPGSSSVICLITSQEKSIIGLSLL